MIDTASSARLRDDWLGSAEQAFNIGFWTWDVAEARLICSQGFYDLVGVNSQSVQLDPTFIETLVHPRDRLTAADSNCLATDPRQNDRWFRLIRPDGQLRWLRSAARSYFDRSGNITKVVAAVVDATELTLIRQQSARMEALLHVVAELTGAALWIAADDGELLDRFNANQRIDLAESTDGQTHWRQIVHPDDMARVPMAWKEAVATRRMYRFHGRMKMQDGNYRDVHAVGLPFSQEHSSEPLWGGISAGDTRLFPQEPEVNQAGSMLLTAGQVRACRALLDWTAETLAGKASISVSTVRRLESTDVTQGQGDSMRLVMLAFREAGLKIWRSDDGRFCVSDLR